VFKTKSVQNIRNKEVEVRYHPLLIAIGIRGKRRTYEVFNYFVNLTSR
jgi:hypothetical protein